MASLIDSITNPLKTAGETAQKLMDLRDTAKFGDAVVKLQAQIMSAQQGALAAHQREAAMAEEIRDLKTRMAELEAWSTEKQRYELTDFGSGTFAYLLKPDMSSGEPEHRLCAACDLRGSGSAYLVEQVSDLGLPSELPTGIIQRQRDVGVGHRLGKR